MLGFRLPDSYHRRSLETKIEIWKGKGKEEMILVAGTKIHRTITFMTGAEIKSIVVVKEEKGVK